MESSPAPAFTPPKLSISIHIDPPTHSFANSPHPPTLHLTITSHHPTPITIYADDLSPKLMIKCGAFKITDLTTHGTEIRQSVRTNCRIPLPSKIPVPLNESLFHTLLPNVLLTLSAPFARTGGKPLPLPLPRSKFDSGLAVAASAHAYADGSDDSVSTRRDACGVDGLEPGHRYQLSLASKSRVCWNVVRWWEYGVKEKVLAGKGDGRGLDGRRVRWGPGPHPAIVVDGDGVEGVVFECVE